MSVLSYYSRPDVQKIMAEFAQSREVVGVFKNGSFGTRPNVILGPSDIFAMAKSGVIEFHCSIEKWSNPMALKGSNYEKLRTGWDLILDIDCANIEHGKAGLRAIVWGLRKHNVKGFWIKFTGGKGFHIGIPWECIPKEIDGKIVVGMFPALARSAIIYLKSYCREKLEKELLALESPEKLAEHVGKKVSEIMTPIGIDPWKIVTIDPILISSRHLFRMPYSINYKTGLVSVFLHPHKVEEFRKEDAAPEKVEIEFPEKIYSETDVFFTNVIDWIARQKKKMLDKKIDVAHKKIEPDLFPPCIQEIMHGLSEGRKRSLFILINFLYMLKWSWPDIEHTIIEWNSRNKPPLSESYVQSQLRYGQVKHVTPPSCTNPTYYTAYGVCKPDSICSGIKNPLIYPFKLLKIRLKNKEKDLKKRSK